MQAESLALRCESEGWLASLLAGRAPLPTTAISLTLSESLHGPLRASMREPTLISNFSEEIERKYNIFIPWSRMMLNIGTFE